MFLLFLIIVGMWIFYCGNENEEIESKYGRPFEP